MTDVKDTNPPFPDRLPTHLTTLACTLHVPYMHSLVSCLSSFPPSAFISSSSFSTCIFVHPQGSVDHADLLDAAALVPHTASLENIKASALHTVAHLQSTFRGNPAVEAAVISLSSPQNLHHFAHLVRTHSLEFNTLEGDAGDEHDRVRRESTQVLLPHFRRLWSGTAGEAEDEETESEKGACPDSKEGGSDGSDEMLERAEGAGGGGGKAATGGGSSEGVGIEGGGSEGGESDESDASGEAEEHMPSHALYHAGPAAIAMVLVGTARHLRHGLSNNTYHAASTYFPSPRHRGAARPQSGSRSHR